MRTGLLVCLLAVGLFTLTAQNAARPSPPFSFKRVGTPAPPPIALSQYRGKIVALAFIHTACPHCQHLTQILIPISHDYAARGVQVLACAFNDDAEQMLPEFLAEYHPTFPVGWSTNALVSAYLQYSEMNPLGFVPHMVFLDSRGIIRADIPGEDTFFNDPDTNIRKQLDKMLKAAVPAKSTKSH
jgi:thiol-disulfide isomerase/thioredoxin